MTRRREEEGRAARIENESGDRWMIDPMDPISNRGGGRSVDPAGECLERQLECCHGDQRLPRHTTSVPLRATHRRRCSIEPFPNPVFLTSH